MADTTTAPPASSSAPAPDPTRGLPYYEKLRRDLRETLQRKNLLDKSLSELETSLYRHETLYLEDTSAGNIIRGFDAYIKGTSTTTTSSSGLNGAGGAGGGGNNRRKLGVAEQDRVFSRSSVGFARERESESPRLGIGEEDEEEGDGVVGVRGAGGQARKKNKGRDAVAEEDGEERGPKRIKISFSGRGGREE